MFNILDLIRCKFHHLVTNNGPNYNVIPANPAVGLLYVTEKNLGFVSGHIRMRGKNGGQYPYRYLEMIDTIFGKNDNTIEVCSGNVKGNCHEVDSNPNTNPDLVGDGQRLDGIPDGRFSRARFDPPYNDRTAKEMYGTDLPNPSKLLKAGARVCKPGSLIFLLLGQQNYQIHPKGVVRIGYVNITVVPNNEVRCLNIFYKLC